MIRLFKVKEKQRENAESANGKPPGKKQSPGELRLQKDMSELNLPKTCNISFPNGHDDLMNFEVSIRPDEGYYRGGIFVFTFQVPPIYVPTSGTKGQVQDKGVSPQYRLGRKCLPQRSPRRLEIGSEHKCHHLWLIPFVYGTQP
uniref:NEDD8-conjugating enzyme Ubc12 n=1 Tax=Kalanchoe fedtschenkoi TaxID=63787 RepID=A0A7N0T087_KALFE